MKHRIDVIKNILFRDLLTVRFFVMFPKLLNRPIGDVFVFLIFGIVMYKAEMFELSLKIKPH